jgi:hypothetical protein
MFRGLVAVVSAFSLALLAGCHLPTRDRSTLEAIKTEARLLMTQSIETDGRIPNDKWPHIIASLKPTFVSVDSEGVDIMTVPGFDGGWGYFVPRNPRTTPKPEGRYDEVISGIYWYHPY